MWVYCRPPVSAYVYAIGNGQRTELEQFVDQGKVFISADELLTYWQANHKTKSPTQVLTSK